MRTQTSPVSRRALLPLLPLLALSGCGALSKLAEIGRPPEMTPPSDPTAEPSWRPLTMPMPKPQSVAPEANSLWRNGSRAFFKDQRAAAVGDIVTVVVSIADTADVQNSTAATRAGSEAEGTPSLLGLQGLVSKFFGSSTKPASLVNTTNATNAAGTGTIKRKDTVTLRLAGVVTQVLSNSNLVVAARQEVRINSELRELQVSGVVRPQDIASDNTVLHDRMAEARISYGGRGTLTTVQTPRYGQQILDVILPF